jgi:hypothetical protein
MKKTWQELEMKGNSSRQPLDTSICQTIVQNVFIASDSGKMTTYFSNQCHVYSLTLAVHESDSEGQV